jgi:Trk K+ transport system NAD-binding subunit
MKGLWNSPARNLVGGVVFVLFVCGLAVAGYLHAGWSLGDAVYMTVITIFTVGYDEVRPIDTSVLRDITISLIVFGCTGMIFVTGALVQFITVTQIQDVLGMRRMNTEIDRLKNHVIVCGFGRLGLFLARDLRVGGVEFVIIERRETRFEEARGLGFKCMCADATEEETLLRAGIARARALATVLPDDAANVFITLSARNLNRGMTIIARGESPSTERKLRHAGANEVVLPAHIGAERVAELLLYSGEMSALRQSPHMKETEADLRRMGLDLELVVARVGDFAELTVGEIERRGNHAFMVVAIERQGRKDADRPQPDTRVEMGDGVLILGRGGRVGMLEQFASGRG